MAEYIEREALMKYADTQPGGLISNKSIQFFQAADVAPVRHGYWVIDDNNTRECHCSECDWPAPRDVYEYHREQTGYCPVCGAKMEIDYYE